MSGKVTYMLKVVLVDDEILVLKLLEKFISTNNNIQVIGSFTKVSVALKEIPKLKPDVAFLDIEMPGLNGIELATKLIKEDEEMDMVFVTAYEQYAINAFQLNAINYILKPIDQDSVDETIKRLIKKRGKREEQSNKDVKIELFGDICIIEENENRKVKWMTNKVEELFALLIINRKSGVSKWKIIDLLWGEINSKKAEQNLYTTIFRLKKSLKEIGIHVSIKNNTGIYNIYLKDIYCDLIDFDRFKEKKLPLNQDTILEFERVTSLYQGDLFGEKAYLWAMNEVIYYYDAYIENVIALANYYAKNKNIRKLHKLYKNIGHILQDEDLYLIKNLIENCDKTAADKGIEYEK